MMAKRKYRIFLLALLLIVGILMLVIQKSQEQNLVDLDDSPLKISNPLTVTHEFDFDVTLAVYLKHLAESTEFEIDGLPRAGFPELPFHWSDWVNITVLNDFINLPKAQKHDCQFACHVTLNKKNIEVLKNSFKSQKKLPFARHRVQAQRSKRCSHYCESDISSYQPGFRITKSLFKTDRVMNHLHVASYLYSEAPNPNNLVILLSQGRNIQVPILSNNKIKDKSQMKMMRSGLYRQFLDEKGSVDIDQYYTGLTKKLNHLSSLPKIDLNKFSIMPLDHEMFVFDAPLHLKENTGGSKNMQNFHTSLESSLSKKDAVLAKYFSEPLLTNDYASKARHLDWRFFTSDGSIDNVTRRDILERMLRTWFQFTLSEGIISWLAHGGLLAHSFNGMLFPYDDDLDVQIPYREMVKLSKRFNNSLILEDLGVSGGPRKAYLFDVTDSLTHRSKGNGLNNIDARFIDVQSGMFIDITVLAVSSSYAPIKYRDEIDSLEKEIKYSDPNVIIEDFYDHWNDDDRDRIKKEDIFLFRTLRKNQLFMNPPAKSATLDNTPEERYDLNYKLKLYNCRNHHFYQLKDISPLRPSYINGIPILIPQKTDTILSEEYKPQLLLASEYGNSIFLPQIRLWVPKGLMVDFYKQKRNLSDIDLDFEDINLLSREDVLEILKNKDVLIDFVESSDYTLLNEKEKMIERDEDMDEDMEGDLHELLKYRSFPKNQVRNLPDSELYALARNQLELEYSKNETYDALGKSSSDFSEIKDSIFKTLGWTIKDILKLYKEEKYDPDIDLKIKNARRAVTKLSGKNEQILQKLLEKKQSLNEVQITGIPRLKSSHLDTGFESQEEKEQEKKLKEEIDAELEKAKEDN